MNQRFHGVPAFTSLLLLAIGLIVTSFAQRSVAQTILDGSTPPGAAPGAPVGSEALSDLEAINLFNGHLNLHVPIIGMGGRGAAQTAMMLAIDNQWSIKTTTHVNSSGQRTYQYIPQLNGGPVVKPGYGPGLLIGRQTGDVNTFSSCGDIYNPYSDYFGGLTRLTFVLPDGTEYELRDQLYGGQPRSPAIIATCNQTGANRGTVFVSADGSATTFISDSDIRDAADTRSVGVFYPTGYLMLRDGTKFRIEGGRISWLRDRNGNSLSFSYTTGPNYGRLQSATDALNRTISVNYDVADVEPYGLCDQITYKGFGDTDKTIRISKSNLHNALRSGFTIKTDLQLFPGTHNGLTIDPIVTTSLWLPNGQRYRFYYNSYVEVARVELPTGGAVEYDYGGFGEAENSGFWYTYPDDGNSVIYRRLIERRVSANGISWDGKTLYGVYETGYETGFPIGVSYAYVNHLEPNDHVGSSQVHTFHGSALDSMVTKRSTDYSAWKAGREYKTEFFAGGDYGIGESPTTPLRVITREWAQRAPVTWWRSAYPTLPLDREPPNDPRLIEVTTKIIEPIMSEPGNLMSKQRFEYDGYNNLTDVYEQEGFGVDSPGSSFSRHTHTSYLTVNPQNGIDYTSTAVHIRNLPTLQIVYAVGFQNETVAAAAETIYDENAYAPLSYGYVTGWIDPGTSARGNPTTTRTWLNINGGAPSVYPAGTYLLNHVQYDQCGNSRNVWDAKGRQLTQSYDDSFADGLPRGTYALLTQSISPAVPNPSQSGQTISFVTTKAYDFSTGLPTAETDPNGQTTTFSYDDPLNRLKTETRPSGGGTTTYEYGDTPGSVYVRTLTSQNVSQTIEDYQCMDGLGRASRSFHYRGNSTYETSDVAYDFMGRVAKVSNPYLSSGPGSAVNPADVWSKTLYDSLGRVTKMIQPDGSEISTTYTSSIEAECTAITVTDAAGKARRQLRDALGRIVFVHEPDADSGDLGDVEDPLWKTRYQYNVLDKLVLVRQFNPAISAEQTRTFAYDSLTRLVSATNPENGTISYQYDENGNLIHRTDWRGVSTTNVYDPLNRIVSQSYSDSTPTATYVYDSPAVANSKGRLVSASSSVASSQYNGYDQMGRPQSLTQIIGSQSYSTVYAYDLLGNLTSLTYPSGRTVSFSYDAAGRALSVSGNLGDGSLRAYSSGIIYSPFGQLSKEQFGTVTPIYNKLFYNLRGQLKEIREGTTYTSPADTSWNRGAIINSYGSCDTCLDNNGNVRKQEHLIPGNDNPQPSTYQVQTQEYEYDPLNRISRVHQGTVWQQKYYYDRLGNRRIDVQNTSSVLQPKAFELEASTNRLLAPGDSNLTGSNINLRRMRYDNAGNLIHDSYTGEGQRDYDAENRMTLAKANNQYQTYGYDATGRRVRRNINGTETWQVYGLAGELLAEYAQNGSPASPQKEYAYRNGHLLIVATAGNGWGSPPTLHDNPLVVGETIIQARHVSELRDAINALRVHLGLPQHTWEESAGTDAWVNAETIIEMRTTLDQALGAPSPAYSAGVAQFQPVKAIHIQELRDRVLAAWSSNFSPQVYWMVTDQLGTPRMVFEQSGSFASVRRHDYLPFGGDLAGIGGRTPELGYIDEGVRQKFTQKERDNETGLDYFGARYYSNIAGRFTSADEPFADQEVLDPQSWNLYSYVRNRPIVFVDPLGRWRVRSCDGDDVTLESDDGDDLESLAAFLSVPLSTLQQIYRELIGKKLQAGEITLWFNRTWVKGFPPNTAHSMGPSDYEFEEDKIGVSTLFKEWLSGKGERNREFGPRSYMTRMMMTSPEVATARNMWLQCSGPPCTRTPSGLRWFGPWGVRYGVRAKDGPVRSVRDGNNPRQFVGSFTIRIIENKNGTAMFTLDNTTGINSGSYHVLPDRTSPGMMSNTHQTYWWIEKVPK